MWKQIIRDNEQAIVAKMVEIYRSVEDGGADHHVGLAITADGDLETWEYEGMYSRPQRVVDSDSVTIARFDSWHWEDLVDFWPDVIRGGVNERLVDEIVEEMKQYEDGEAEYVKVYFPKLYEELKEDVIDIEMAAYEDAARDIVDDLAYNTD